MKASVSQALSTLINELVQASPYDSVAAINNIALMMENEHMMEDDESDMDATISNITYETQEWMDWHVDGEYRMMNISRHTKIFWHVLEYYPDAEEMKVKRTFFSDGENTDGSRLVTSEVLWKNAGTYLGEDITRQEYLEGLKALGIEEDDDTEQSNVFRMNPNE